MTSLIVHGDSRSGSRPPCAESLPRRQQRTFLVFLNSYAHRGARESGAKPKAASRNLRDMQHRANDEHC
jgi:tRNA(His) 5'-end guanylyltransferase